MTSGGFDARDVRAPLERILNRQYKISAFARHLHTFCGDVHGRVFIKCEGWAAEIPI